MDLTRRISRHLNSFLLNPSVSFETQHKDEKVILLLRAHPITQVPWIFNSLVLMILLVVINYFARPYLNTNQLLFLILAGGVFIFSYIWFNFLNWFFNVGIVTNERIVDIDFSNVLYKEVSSARLENIEDITSRSAGYFGALFDYGNVFLQTAGNMVNLEFISIPNPSEVVAIINQLQPKKKP